jgi:hypothetical protein
VKWGETEPVPELKLANGQLTNWLDVERWGYTTSRLWRDAIAGAARHVFGHSDAFKVIAYHQAIEIQELRKKVAELHAIAPRRMRHGDTVWIWHCPDNLIPEEKV